MDLLEHQGKELFASFGLPISPGALALTPTEAVAAAERIGCPVVVKAQVHTGGRGKAGGIRLAEDLEAVSRCAEKILGLDIKGHVVRRLWVEAATDIAAEFYVSFMLDRGTRRHLGMLSAQGGVDIEDVSANSPEAISRIQIDPSDGFAADDARNWVTSAGLPGADVSEAVEVLLALYRAYREGDADLIEVNPLVLTTDGRLQVLDAKVTLDSSARFRHPEYDAYDKTAPRDAREQQAHSRGLQYVGLEGNVGVIANGAGLAMASVDMVSDVGGSAANFLDIGGGANAEVMSAALEVLNDDPSVRAIFINIFGGITKGEEVANGIIEAMRRVDIASPIVVRLDGTNSAEGWNILRPRLSDRLELAPDMLAAARLAVGRAGGVQADSPAGAGSGALEEGAR